MSAALDLDPLIDAWRGPLVGLLAGRGASPLEAQELAMDTFAEAWLARERFRGDFGNERQVGAWLAGIATNLHRVAQRRAAQGPRPLDGTEDRAAEPAEKGEEQVAPLLAAIAELPERQRIVVQAFYLEETSTERVAALLGTSSRAVEGLLRRARAQLHATLRGVEAATRSGAHRVG